MAALVAGEERSFYWRVSGRHNLELWGALRGMRPAEAGERARELLDHVGLAEAGERRVQTYSSGMRQRLAMARALMGRPRVLLCDELTRALDEEGSERLWSLASEEVERGAALLATATRLDDLAGRCDRILFLDGGPLDRRALGRGGGRVSTLATTLRGSFLRDARIQLGYPGALVMGALAALFSPLLFYFLARFVGNGVEDELGRYGGSYFAFVLVGLVVTTFLTVTVATFGRALRQPQLLGRARGARADPGPHRLDPDRLLAVALPVGAGPGDRPGGHRRAVHGGGARRRPARRAVAGLLLMASLVAVGLMISAVVLSTKRGEAVTLAVSTGAMLLGGLYYPISVLPQPLESIAEALPIWHGTEALRLALLQGEGVGGLAADLWPVALFTVIALPRRCGWSSARSSCAVQRGTLGQH